MSHVTRAEVSEAIGREFGPDETFDDLNAEERSALFRYVWDRGGVDPDELITQAAKQAEISGGYSAEELLRMMRRDRE